MYNLPTLPIMGAAACAGALYVISTTSSLRFDMTAGVLSNLSRKRCSASMLSRFEEGCKDVGEENKQHGEPAKDWEILFPLQSAADQDDGGPPTKRARVYKSKPLYRRYAEGVVFMRLSRETKPVVRFYVKKQAPLDQGCDWFPSSYLPDGNSSNAGEKAALPLIQSHLSAARKGHRDVRVSSPLSKRVPSRRSPLRNVRFALTTDPETEQQMPWPARSSLIRSIDDHLTLCPPDMINVPKPSILLALEEGEIVE